MALPRALLAVCIAVATAQDPGWPLTISKSQLETCVSQSSNFGTSFKTTFMDSCRDEVYACISDTTPEGCDSHLNEIETCLQIEGPNEQCIEQALYKIVTYEEANGMTSTESNLHTCLFNTIDSFCDSSSDGLSTGAIVGIVFGTVIGAGLLIGISYMVWLRTPMGRTLKWLGTRSRSH